MFVVGFSVKISSLAVEVKCQIFMLSQILFGKIGNS
jgi:hypothetical protein